MIQEAVDLLVERTLQDQIFLLLVVGIGILLLAAIGFAALTVVLRYQNEQTAQRWRRLEQAWEPLVLDILAGDAPAEALWNEIGDADRTYFVDFLLRYARRLRGSELEVVRRLARPFLEPVVLRARSGDLDERARAVQTLAALGLPEHRARIVEALDDDSPAVAMVAARALADEDGAAEVREILDRLHRFELWSQTYLADLLASFGPEAGPDLEAVYTDESAPPTVRAICCDALTQIGTPESPDLAVQVLQNQDLDAVAAEAGESGEVTRFGEERELVISSLRLLEELGRPDHLPVVRSLEDSRDPVLRSLTMAVLGRAGEPETDGAAVRSGLENPSPWVALHAARALVQLGLTEELERLAGSGSPRADLAREVLSR